MGMVMTEPSVFFSEMVRAATSTPVISASREVPALLVHLRISAWEVKAATAQAVNVNGRRKLRDFMAVDGMMPRSLPTCHKRHKLKLTGMQRTPQGGIC